MAGRILRRSWRWEALRQKQTIGDFALAHDIDVPENPQYTRSYSHICFAATKSHELRGGPL
jgi:hypothetical protein